MILLKSPRKVQRMENLGQESGAVRQQTGGRRGGINDRVKRPPRRGRCEVSLRSLKRWFRKGVITPRHECAFIHRQGVSAPWLFNQTGRQGKVYHLLRYIVFIERNLVYENVYKKLRQGSDPQRQCKSQLCRSTWPAVRLASSLSEIIHRLQ